MGFIIVEAIVILLSANFIRRLLVPCNKVEKLQFHSVSLLDCYNLGHNVVATMTIQVHLSMLKNLYNKHRKYSGSCGSIDCVMPTPHACTGLGFFLHLE